MRNKRYTFDKGLARAISNFAHRNGVFSIIDVGCGNGAYCMYFDSQDFYCDGFDGNPHTPEITDNKCAVVDFSEPVDMKPYDLVVSLEVAEHIPAERESVFLDNITSISHEFIVLSWAIEGQGGVGHVNCRNNDYVIDRMRDYGFVFLPKETKLLRQEANVSWFRKTVMAFKFKIDD